MARVCGNCRTTQGPFARLRVGTRKSGRWVFTCPPNKAGKTPAERVAPVIACNDRRAKLDKEGALNAA